MKYDLGNPLHREQLKARVERAIQRGAGVCEFVEHKPARTLRQNAYLHLIISLLATELGETAEWCKERYFKAAANAELFTEERNDKFLGRVKTLRSTASLTTDEMTLAIERFRDWASQVAGVYLPSADEKRLLELAEVDVGRAARWI